MRTATTYLVVLLTLVLAGGPARAASPAYKGIDLGTLGGLHSFAMDVNAAGAVVGDASMSTAFDDHAFIWTESGGLTDVVVVGGLSFANHVTDSGQVVGVAFMGGIRPLAFSWTKLGGLIALGTLGGHYSVPTDVNEGGMVVGYSSAAYSEHAFAWTAAHGMSDLGTLGGPIDTSVPARVYWPPDTKALAVNNVGQAVGHSLTPAGEMHAVLWSGSIRDLGTLGGIASSAEDVSDSGQVVGWSATSTGQTHAFSWTDAGGTIDLGTLGGPTSRAIEVNNAGQVVGTSTTSAGEQRVFSWTPDGGMVDIGTLGGAQTGLGGQYRLLNDAGQVVGSSDTSTGASHAFVWSEATGMIDLGTLGGVSSGGVAISETGFVAGFWVSAGATRAAFWKPVDTTPPALDVPASLVADATSPAGAVVTFTVTATDDVDPAPAITCSPASGTTFAIGTTTVTCTATDASGNSATASFTVHVRGAAEQLVALRELTASLGLQPTVARSLDRRLQRAQTSLAQNRPLEAVLVLHAFAAEVRVLPTLLIAPDDASALANAATRIWTVIG